MKKLNHEIILLISLLLFVPTTVSCQLPDTLREKVRNSTSNYSIHDDTIPITCSKTLPCLEVRINGKGPYNFLIDLGSNIVLFKQSIVEEANVDILIDRSSGDIVKAGILKIGNSIFSNVHGAAYENLDVDGVIGFNLLKKANFFIDYPNMQFAFIGKEPGQKDSTYIKYELMSRMPYLKSKIGNSISYVNFDTGADLWLYFPLRLKDSLQFKTPVTEFKEMGNNQTGKTMTYMGQIKEDIIFGNYTIVSPYIVFDPNIEDIYVGSSLLNQFKLSFFPNLELVKMDRLEKGNLIVIPKNQKKNSK